MASIQFHLAINSIIKSKESPMRNAVNYLLIGVFLLSCGGGGAIREDLDGRIAADGLGEDGLAPGDDGFIRGEDALGSQRQDLFGTKISSGRRTSEALIYIASPVPE